MGWEDVPDDRRRGKVDHVCFVRLNRESDYRVTGGSCRWKA